AMSLLARMAIRDPKQIDQLEAVIAGRFDRLAVVALQVAAQVSEPALIARAVIRAGEQTSVEEVQQVLDQLPKESLAFGDLITQLAMRTVERLNDAANRQPDLYRPMLSHSLNDLSVRLMEMHRYDEAHAVAEQAIATYRELTLDRPDAFLPGLAASLTNQSIALADLGKHEEALAAADEAVSRYRELAEARPGTSLPGLAASLTNQSARLAALGIYEQGLA